MIGAVPSISLCPVCRSAFGLFFEFDGCPDCVPGPRLVDHSISFYSLIRSPPPVYAAPAADLQGDLAEERPSQPETSGASPATEGEGTLPLGLVLSLRLLDRRSSTAEPHAPSANAGGGREK
jgi:hypothetical protein